MRYVAAGQRAAVASPGAATSVVLSMHVKVTLVYTTVALPTAGAHIHTNRCVSFGPDDHIQPSMLGNIRQFESVNVGNTMVTW